MRWATTSANRPPLAISDGGGLFGIKDAINFIVRDGEVIRVDGPYAEAKEVVGGWALMQYDTLEVAVAGQQEFAELHAKYWPGLTSRVLPRCARSPIAQRRPR